MPAETLEIRNVPAKRLGELKRAADRAGVSTEDYLKRVLLEHLARIRRIENASFAELAAPLRTRLGAKSEEELDALVDAARARRNARKRRSA